MSPAIQTYSDTEFAHLTAQLAKVTAERDRARRVAVALEQEVAQARERAIHDAADALMAERRKHDVALMRGTYATWLHDNAARITRGGAA